MAHACNPSYSGGSNQEDRGSKTNSSQDLITEKNPSQKKRADGVAQRIGPEFKPQYCKERKKETPEGTLVLSSAILPIYRVLILTS
jgi:hypothetical protein